MQAGRFHIQLALIALATIGVAAVAALFFLGDDVETSSGVAAITAKSPPAREARSATLDQGLGGRFLHALRGNLTGEASPASLGGAEATPSEPQQQAMALPDGRAPGYVAYEVEAPQPPRRPAQLGETAQDYPLPPRRPAQLGPAQIAEATASPLPALAAAPPQQQGRAQPPQPLLEPAAQQTSSWYSPFGGAASAPSPAPEPTLVDAPQPPRRPVRLAALVQPPAAAPATIAPATASPAPLAPTPATAIPETTTHNAPPATTDNAAEAPGKGSKNGKTEDRTPPAGVQVAVLPPEAGLRPAPSESFEQEDQAPKRFNMGAPVFIRIFKKEGELELWMKVKQHYSLYRTFPICKWSGKLGPKLREADYQSPEGFYSVSAKQLNPHSNYYRAFNVGYPNAFDKQNGHTGGLVMVHGNCKSVGCFAMTDKGVEEIYGFVAAALLAGQKEVPVHIFPFRMTEAALERETGGGFLSFFSGETNGQRWKEFWRNLKEGYDRFEATREPPVAYACGDHYAFDANGGCQRIAGW